MLKWHMKQKFHKYILLLNKLDNVVSYKQPLEEM